MSASESKSVRASKSELAAAGGEGGSRLALDTKGSRAVSRMNVAKSQADIPNGSAEGQDSGEQKAASAAAPVDDNTPKSGESESAPANPVEKPPVGVALAPGNPSAEIPTSGILPLFLTSMTQDLFKVRSGEDVTAEKPIKIIPKADLISDIQARLAISDFQPAKAQILEYPGDELLLYYDADFKYGQNFFLCITKEVVDTILTPPADQVSEADAKKSKKPQSKPWVSLGSEKEIEEEQVTNTRDLIHIKLSKKRKDFGSPATFSDKTAEVMTECKSFKDSAFEMNRMELNVDVQAVPRAKNKAAQTNWFKPVNFSVQYEPLQMSQTEKQTILRSDELIDFVKSVQERFEQALQQNTVVDIFIDDYKALGEDELGLDQSSHIALQEYQSFTDLKHSKDKSISCIDWHPTQKGVVGVSCVSRLTLDERIEKGFPVRSKQALILIWSFHDPIHPQVILESPDDINCFQFNPSDPNIIAGGCVNGQIVLWDITEYQDRLKSSRKGQKDGSTSEESSSTDKGPETVPIVKHTATSSIEFSHHAAIADLQWLPSSHLIGHNGEVSENPDGGNRQLVTGSLDGHVCFWDTKSRKDYKPLDLVWKPFLRVPLSSMDNTFDYGITKVCLKPPNLDKPSADQTPSSAGKEKVEKEAVVSSKFFAGTEEGDLIYTDWFQEKTNEEKASRVETALSWHYGSVTDVHRSPFFPDIILSVGGWSFHIWREKLFSGSVVSSAPSSTYLIGGRWSPTRPGVFFLSRADGIIEIWDLLDKSHAPVATQNISSIGISYLTINQYKSAGQYVAAADDDGTLHILEVPKNLSKPTKNEKSIIKTFFDREVKRILYVTERKQVRIRDRAKWEQALLESQPVKGGASAGKETAPAAAAPAAEVGAAHAPSAATASPDDDTDKLEQEFGKFEQSFLEIEGLGKSD